MKVAIIGYGMVGNSIAYECAKAGAQVTLLDAGRLGGLASAASFAWLNATSISAELVGVKPVEGPA